MKRHGGLAALLFLIFPALALAAECEVPPFDVFVPAAMRPAAPALVSVEIAMRPVATVRIPAGFSKVGAFPYGTLGFGEHPEGISVVLGYETEDSIAPHKKDSTPAAFMTSIFKGLDRIGCQYMAGQGLADEDYRLYAQLGKGAELFAYGSAKDHQFYVIREDRPDFVMRALFKNISRAEFESILAAIELL